MSDWINEIVKIQKIEKHPNADTLSIATVMDVYPVVIKTGSFNVGDLAAYIAVDTVVPVSDDFRFLFKNDEPKLSERRLKSKKIRDVYSEGLLIPAPNGFSLGDDVVKHFKLEKYIYDEEQEEQPQVAKGSNENEKSPKTFSLSKYDLEGLAKYGYAFEEGENVVITEKLDGCNASFTYAESKLWVKSRNYFKRNGFSKRKPRTIGEKILRFFEDFKENIVNYFKPKKHTVSYSKWWDVPIRYDLETKLKKYPNLTIYGELIGEVRSFPYDTQIVDGKRQLDFRVFDVYNNKTKKFLNWNEVEVISADLGLKTAPILYSGPWKADMSLYELAEGQSTIGNHIREGFVVRSEPVATHPALGRKIAKLKGKGYKLFKK